MGRRGDDFRYEEMPDEEMADECNRDIKTARRFISLFQDRFAKGGYDCILGSPDEEILLDISIPMLMEIRKRIDQRDDYYKYFHSEENDLSRTKEIALSAYWILKYKPLFLLDDVQKNLLFIKKACTVNEYFATYCIESYVQEVLNTKGYAFCFSDEEYDKMVYNFMHRDISKEAMICLVGAFLRDVEK